jgi:hypothetical protein
MHFNGYGNLGRDKLWDLKICLRLQEFHYLDIISMSLCYVVMHEVKIKEQTSHRHFFFKDYTTSSKFH